MSYAFEEVKCICGHFRKRHWPEGDVPYKFCMKDVGQEWCDCELFVVAADQKVHAEVNYSKALAAMFNGL
jgi:hypothetical protein